MKQNTTKILALMKKLKRDICVHDVEFSLKISPGHFANYTRKLINKKIIEEMPEKSVCKYLDRTHIFYRLKSAKKIVYGRRCFNKNNGSKTREIEYLKSKIKLLKELLRESYEKM